MTDEELEQQDKQEQKEECQEERKKTLKTVITSVICTLLFVVILLLLVILCLKNCSNRNNNNNTSSSNSTSEPTWTEYDNASLNSVFKKLVSNQVYVDMGTDNPPDVDSIVAVSYSDSGTLFTLNVDAKIGSNLYYYSATNVSYSGHPNFVEYLLTLNLNTDLPLIEGDPYGVSLLAISNEKLTNEKSTSYVITNSATNKYLSGYYFENNQYYVYQKVELNNTDSFPSLASQTIDVSSPLYSYYRFLNA